MNCDGEIRHFPEGENPGKGWIRLPDLADRFTEPQQPAPKETLTPRSVRRKQARTSFSASLGRTR